MSSLSALKLASFCLSDFRPLSSFFLFFGGGWGLGGSSFFLVFVSPEHAGFGVFCVWGGGGRGLLPQAACQLSVVVVIYVDGKKQ